MAILCIINPSPSSVRSFNFSVLFLVNLTIHTLQHTIYNLRLRIIIFFLTFFIFLVRRFFSSIALAIGMGLTFLIFGVCCACGFLFTLFFLPETKGKSFQEIQEMLAGRYVLNCLNFFYK